MIKQKRLFPVSSWTGSESSWSAAIGSRNGFTLMELLVYMMIVGIIVIIAGQAFSDSTKFRVRTQNMLKATQEAENVATLFKADVAQMGAKSSKENGTATGGAEFGDAFSSIYTDVYINPPGEGVEEDAVDYSSFTLTTNDGNSDLTFRRVRYNDLGYYDAVDEIRWFVDDNTLYRSCYTISGNELKEGDGADAISLCKDIKNKSDKPIDDAVEIATNVATFEVVAPTPTTLVDERIFPTTGSFFRLVPRTGEEHYYELNSVNESLDPNGAGDIITLTNFYTNYDESANQLKTELGNMNQVIAANAPDPVSFNWKNVCQNYGKLGFEKDNTYEISFEVPYVNSFSTQTTEFELQPFVPGEDHMSVGFRGMNTGDFVVNESGKKIIDDFLFFPPYNANGSGTRYMRFTVPVDIPDTVCLAFTFACYSPKAYQAKLKIKNLTIKKIAGVNYDFKTTFDTESNKSKKKNIKALKLKLKIARGGKNGENGETGDIEMVVPTPSNGPRD